MLHPRTDPRFGLSCQRAQYMIAARKGRAAGCKSTARTCKTGRKAPAHTPKTRLFSPLPPHPSPPRLKTCGTPGFGCQHTKQPPNSATVLGFWPPKSFVLHEAVRCLLCFASLPCPLWQPIKAVGAVVPEPRW